MLRALATSVYVDDLSVALSATKTGCVMNDKSVIMYVMLMIYALCRLVQPAYQYAKASRYKDSATEDKILCSSTPAEAKQAGLHVRNFDRADWEEAKKGIMLELLRIKFQAGSEMNKFLKNTSGKSLAEAGKSRSFAIGMPLNSKNIFDTSKWPKNCNMLGKCLMEVRTELNA